MMTLKLNKVGYWSGLAAFAAVVAYDVVQILQIAGVLHFPLDEILIYGTSLCIAIPFILEMLSFHHLTARDKQFWTHASLIFTTIYAVFVIANYVVQLATPEFLPSSAPIGSCPYARQRSGNAAVQLARLSIPAPSADARNRT